ncbi:hypothetical protein AB0L33_28335 [Streptomyces sp. NPDC052299]|uniref:hypothetical protein n=1 Tax=Streptomyces sp. NPDC052299 TaxID=3155054 RepID=UPI003442E24A
MVLGHRFPVESIGELPLSPHLTNLTVTREANELRLEGIEQWTELEDLRLDGRSQFRYLSSETLRKLRRLTVQSLDDLDLASPSGASSLKSLDLYHCRLRRGLEPLTDLPWLKALSLYVLPGDLGDDEAYDLSPLAGLAELTITLGSDTPVVGAELFPPERITRLG